MRGVRDVTCSSTSAPISLSSLNIVAQHLMISDFSHEIIFTTVGNRGNSAGNYVAQLLEPKVHCTVKWLLYNAFSIMTFENSCWLKKLEHLSALLHSPNVWSICCLHFGRQSRDSDDVQKLCRAWPRGPLYFVPTPLNPYSLFSASIFNFSLSYLNFTLHILRCLGETFSTTIMNGRCK